MFLSITLAFVICLVGAFAIHTGTRAIMGLAADTLPGGAFVMVASLCSMMPDRLWVIIVPAILGGAAGHYLSAWCWNNASVGKVKEK